MAEEVQLTTIQIDTATRDALKMLAEKDFRTMISELRWLVAAEASRRNGAQVKQEEQQQPTQA